MKTLQKKSRHCKSFAVTAPNIVSLYNDGHRPNAHKQVGTTKTTISFLKNILLILAFFILGFGSELKAQESPKWEIGTDLLWLVGKNSLPDYSLFSRWHYKPNRAFRIRIGTDLQTDPTLTPRKVFKANFMIRLGHEWSKQIAKKTDLFGGIEAHYQKDEIQAWLIPVPNALPFYFPDYSSQIGGVGFIGCRYFINRNFSISMETSLKGAHRTYQLNTYSGGIMVTKDNFVLEGGALKFLYQTPVRGMIFEIKPIQVLNFSYHF